MEYDTKYFLRIFRECPQPDLCSLIESSDTFIDFVNALVAYMHTHDVSEFNKFINPTNPSLSGIDPFIFTMYWFFHCRFAFTNQLMVSEVLGTNISLASLIASHRLKLSVLRLDSVPRGSFHRAERKSEWRQYTAATVDMDYLIRSLAKVQLVTNLTS